MNDPQGSPLRRAKDCQVANLMEYPQHVALVAGWIYGEFWANTSVHTPGSLEQLLRQATNPDRIPLSLIALVDGEPAGTVNLVENDDELRPHLRPWLAALFVVAKQRCRGIGTDLVGALADKTAALGISTLYLGTDNPSFYMRLSAAVQEQVTDRFAVMRLSCPTPRSVAGCFAKALDADDFESAITTLSPECQYSFNDELLQGPDTIIQSYRDASEKAKQLFDRIDYRSELVEIGAERVVVKFWDRLEVRGQSHLYSSKQQLTFSPDGRIVRIDHEEISGEREALDAFLNEWKLTK